MYDIAVIGAGPAGASAALFAAKAGKNTVLIHTDKSMTKRAWLENYYGIEEISGPDLIDIGKKQAVKFGAAVKEEKVQNIVKIDAGFRIETTIGQYEAKYIIIATGALTELAEHLGLKTKPATEPRIKTVIDVDTNGQTSLEGIWAAGTAAGVSVHAIITAGDGARVAINVISEINGERYVDHDILKTSE